MRGSDVQLQLPATVELLLLLFYHCIECCMYRRCTVTKFTDTSAYVAI
jgi:hypothetical protein